MNNKISDAQLRIIEARHHDPFTILGLHQHGIEELVRVFLPRAISVELINQAEKLKMTRIENTDFFECYSPRGQIAHNYQIIWLDEFGYYHTQHDPYRFVPQIPEFDLHLFSEGKHWHIYRFLGAHPWVVDGIKGVLFATWAPNAARVSVVGDFNHWDGRIHQMRVRGGSGVWELFIPGITSGTLYKFEIRNRENGLIYLKSDPYAQQFELRPATACMVPTLSHYAWNDAKWLASRPEEQWQRRAITIYEVHLGSWQRDEHGNFLNYHELAHNLVAHVKALGFTHIELLPIAEHPFDGSWGYQVTGYYAATSRYGAPEDLMYFIDQCHQNGIGIIVDWVPGHFPKDGHGLAYFDGTHLFEHEDPRKGEHKGWGTLVFNYGRNEVRNFLVANALFWFDKYHIDGIRVDAVASMLYLDYDREDGEWVTNQYGGRENIEAVEFLRQVNGTIFNYFPGILSIAEESTAWAMVSRPPYMGGLGFNMKWNMGWMHDMLDYFSMDPWFRQFHQNSITFSMWYHHSENYMLALSHDEIVHGKSNMIGKMPGDEWQKFANIRTLFSYMFAHPGKKTMFMSMEFGQWSEWNVWGDLEWHLLQYPVHQGLQKFIADANTLLKQEPALHEIDNSWDGFQWIDCNDNHNSVVSFIRRAKDGSYLVVVCNFTPVTHYSYRIGVPEHTFYAEILNSDATVYCGSGQGNLGGKQADDWGYHGQPCSLDLCLPPLGVLVLKPRDGGANGC